MARFVGLWEPDTCRCHFERITVDADGTHTDAKIIDPCVVHRGKSSKVIVPAVYKENKLKNDAMTYLVNSVSDLNASSIRHSVTGSFDKRVITLVAKDIPEGLLTAVQADLDEQFGPGKIILKNR